MFGKNSSSHVPPSSHDEAQVTYNSLYSLAEAAFSRGSMGQAAHLYLAAFDASAQITGDVPSRAVDGLRKAWECALATKDRALAEHIFEKLEPYSTSDDIAEHTEALQRLALDKLEEFGFSREDLQDMADMVSEDFLGLPSGVDPDAVFTQAFTISRPGASSSVKAQHPRHARSQTPEKVEPQTKAPRLDDPSSGERFTYDDLVGFDRAIEDMKKRGIGLANDKAFAEFLDVLARRHGIDGMPSFETMLFRSYSREDANQFMAATAFELGLPCVRMFMEDTPMGYPVLCVMSTSDFTVNPSVRGGFSGPAVLVLEDVDLWGAPFSNEFDDADMPSSAYMSRGAREAVMFIRAAVENPDVHVLATCANDAPLDDFFLDLLDPISYVDVDVPNETERDHVWSYVAHLYPSLRFMNRGETVRLSANMSRYDIFCAAREAVDQAYKESVEARTYIPVTRDNLFNKIAAYQPLDSSEYHELEETLVESLMNDIADMQQKSLPATSANEPATPAPTDAAATNTAPTDGEDDTVKGTD